MCLSRLPGLSGDWPPPPAREQAWGLPGSQGPCTCPTSMASREPLKHRTSPGSTVPPENTASCPCPVPAQLRAESQGSGSWCCCRRRAGAGGGHTELAKLQAFPEQAASSAVCRSPPPTLTQEGGKELAHFTDGSKAQEKAIMCRPLVLAPQLLPSGPPYPPPAPTAPLKSRRVPVCRAEPVCALSLLQGRPRVKEPLRVQPGLQHPSWGQPGRGPGT